MRRRSVPEIGLLLRQVGGALRRGGQPLGVLRVAEQEERGEWRTEAPLLCTGRERGKIRAEVPDELVALHAREVLVEEDGMAALVGGGDLVGVDELW